MEFTYETNDNKTVYETYEWDNVWIEQANDNKSERVLYIGDSISCGTRGIANTAADGRYLFDGFGTSKSIDNPYFKDAVKLFALQLPKIDNVLFNNGLHGWHLDDEAYEKYYDDMVKFLTEEFDGKKIHIVLTTAIRDEKRTDIIKKRNAAAVKTAQKYSLPIIDLYTLTSENLNLLIEDGVHGTEEMYKKISTVILDGLNK